MAVVSPVATQATVPKKLTWRNYSGYAAGDAANNLAFAMSSSFLLLYYTNVVGLQAAAIGTMFLLVRFWDALADLVAGRLVDAKKPGRLGKFRPFILWFSLPLLLSSMAIFSANTFFPAMSAAQGLLYAYITYAVMGTLYSMVNIPYGSIATAMTQVPTERATLASWRVWGSNITILMLSFVVAPQIKRFTGDPEGLQRSLFITTAIFVAVGMALYLYTVANVKEQVIREVAAPTLRESINTLIKNKPLIWLCAGSLAFLTGGGIHSGDRAATGQAKRVYLARRGWRHRWRHTRLHPALRPADRRIRLLPARHRVGWRQHSHVGARGRHR